MINIDGKWKPKASAVFKINWKFCTIYIGSFSIFPETIYSKLSAMSLITDNFYIGPSFFRLLARLLANTTVGTSPFRYNRNRAESITRILILFTYHCNR